VLWPSKLTVAGAVIALDEVLAAVTIHHGRQGTMDQATPSTCQVELEPVPRAFVQAFTVGAPLALEVRDGAAAPLPRFTGWITDAALDDDHLTVVAVALVSKLGRYPIGAADWPVETWTARVTRCFAEAGLSSSLELQAGPFNPTLAARTAATAGPTTLADYLNFLAPMVGAAVVDRPNGKVLVQASDARTLATLYRLDPAAIAFAPVWREELPAGNRVTVRYTGDQSQSVIVSDATSVAFYGERAATIDTNFSSVVDATTRANQRVARTAFAHWTILDASVLRGLDLAVGQALELDTMPPASPFLTWTPILEGWTDTISGEDWTMALALSDPLASGLSLPWVAVPTTLAYQWNTIDQALAWKDALTLDELAA
jgi:hypothetical protein